MVAHYYPSCLNSRANRTPIRLRAVWTLTPWILGIRASKIDILHRANRQLCIICIAIILDLAYHQWSHNLSRLRRRIHSAPMTSKARFWRNDPSLRCHFPNQKSGRKPLGSSATNQLVLKQQDISKPYDKTEHLYCLPIKFVVTPGEMRWAKIRNPEVTDWNNLFVPILSWAILTLVRFPLWISQTAYHESEKWKAGCYLRRLLLRSLLLWPMAADSYSVAQTGRILRTTMIDGASIADRGFQPSWHGAEDCGAQK